MRLFGEVVGGCRVVPQGEASHDILQHTASGCSVRSSLAVGDTVILLTTPSASLLKHLLKVKGGAAE